MGSSKTEDELIEFLSRPENFDVALDVYEKFPAVRRNLQTKFWRGFKKELETRIREEPGRFSGWICEEATCGPIDNYFYVALKPEQKESRLYCCLSVRQWTVAYHFKLHQGVMWSEGVLDGQEPKLPEVERITFYLRDVKKFSGWNGWGPWIGATAIFDLFGADTLRQLNQNKGIECRLRVDDFVALFFDTKQLMEDLNAKLATERASK